MRLYILCVFIIGVAKAVPFHPLCGCAPDYPVCGSDFKTYSSECQMNCDNRLNPNRPVVIARGRCEDILNPYNPNPYIPNPYIPNPFIPYPCNPNDPFSPCNGVIGSSQS